MLQNTPAFHFEYLDTRLHMCVSSYRSDKFVIVFRSEDTGLGPVTVRTPFGLQESDWLLGLKKYAERVMKLS